MHLRWSPVLWVLLISSIYKGTATSTENSNEDLLEANLDIEINSISKKEHEDNEYKKQRAQYAKKMISYMNQSIDPCDDFYEYACGNWKNTIPKRNTLKRRNNMYDIDFELNVLVSNLLENPNEEFKQKYAAELKNARTFYKSCLEADLQKLPKSDVYLEAINHIVGFPAINETWQPKNFDWFKASAQLIQYGANTLINELIDHQFASPPYFEIPELGFDKMIGNDSISNTTTQNYKSNEQIMREYLKTYGAVETKITEVVESIFELWRAILNVTAEFNNDEDLCTELGTAKNITTWRKFETYFEIAWNGLKYEYDNFPCAYLYTKLDEICNERKEAVANYLALKFLHHIDTRLLDEALHKEFCDTQVKNSMKFLIDQLFMAEYFHLEDYDELFLINKEIRSSLRQKIKTLSWLDVETRNEALLKESKMTFRIGRWEDAELMEKLIQEIKNLHLEENNYERNNLEILKFIQSMHRYLFLHLENVSNDTRPIDMFIGMQGEAYYDCLHNSINIMAGILNPPVFHKSWPLALKYGTYGYTLGHELTHAFDTFGSLFDGDGNMRPWWKKEAKESFKNLTKCYIEAFNKYEVPEIHQHINGDTTINENIADHGGLHHAFNAYQSHNKKLSIAKNITESSITETEHMPGLDMTPEQLFYLGFAQLWCAAYEEENYWQELKDLHTIDKYRVLGALSNTKEFSTAFGCAVGSKMNPAINKCELW